MSFSDPTADELFEKFLDSQLDAAEQASADQLVRDDRARAGEAALQGRIDRTLGTLFEVDPPSEAALAAMIVRQPAAVLGEKGHPNRRSLGWIAALATAAAVAAIALWRPWSGPGVPEARFTPQPLATIYRMAVKQGFEPYYECHDAERFAQTFAHRQQIPLELLPMGAGARMLGLSYLGGLSPDTTAMLCMVDEQPVIVFVDRVAADNDAATKKLAPDLHVFRRAEHGLVIYEVTPLAEARVLDSLAPAKSAG